MLQKLICQKDVDESIVAPAGSGLDTEVSDSAAKLFPSEGLQLTDAVIANLSALSLTHLDLFSFEDPSSTLSGRKRSVFANAKCKTYPGDFLWPSTLVWRLFDILLGGALVKTIPYAVSCE